MDVDDGSNESETPQKIIWGRFISTLPNSIPKVFLFTEDKYTFGRLDSDPGIDRYSLSELGVPKFISRSCSAVHLTIHRERLEYGNVVHMKTTGTFGHTYVNGRMANEQVLVSDDQISLLHNGSTMFTFSESLENGYPGRITDLYQVTDKEIGHGSFGRVMEVYRKGCTVPLAMKEIVKMNLRRGVLQPLNPNKHFQYSEVDVTREIEIMKTLSHPCVIRALDIVDTEAKAYIMMNFAVGGDLFDRIVAPRRCNMGLREMLSKFYFYQLLQAIQYLHGCHVPGPVIHRDLKPENILLASRKEMTLIKVADFGLSKCLRPGTSPITRVGTRAYMAPEIAAETGTRTRLPYTMAVDLWSSGAILFLCLCGYEAFSPHNSQMPLLQQIQTRSLTYLDENWAHITIEARDMVEKLLELNVDKRLTAEEALAHPWIQNDGRMQARVDRVMRAEELQTGGTGSARKRTERLELPP